MIFLIVVPIWVGQKSFGWIDCYSSRIGDAFSDDFLRYKNKVVLIKWNHVGIEKFSYTLQ